jgi:hypothetical protein
MLSSNLEIKIHLILESLGINFKEEYEFDDLISSSGRKLRFDFAIFDDNNNLVCLIEAQGRQHYQSVKAFGGNKGLHRQQYNDNMKRQYCLKNRIKLVSIPYYDENKLSKDYLLRVINGY